MSKRPNDGNNQNKQFKRSRLYNARIIRSQVRDSAFKDGVLDVPSFINSRKYETDQLERAQLKSRYASSTRVFQALPRKLRRRAASHNVKRIPKRLRNRAIREMLLSNKLAEDASELNKKKKKRCSSNELYRMKLSRNLLKLVSKLNMLKILPSAQLVDKNLNIRSIIRILSKQIKDFEASKKEKARNLSGDIEMSANVPTSIRQINNRYGSYDTTGINALAVPPIARIKYLKRQKTYKWLSTHIWHAKRFHLINRWGWNIPYKPTQKSFRLAHRNFKNTGALVFDTSYEGTMILETAYSEERNSSWLELKELVQRIIQKTLSMSYISGRRFYSGDMYLPEGRASQSEAKDSHNLEYEVFSTGTVFCNLFNGRIQVYFQVHPAGFDEAWSYINSNISEQFKDQITMQDCRYSLGSIDLIGPKSLEALVSILHPINKDFNEAWGKLTRISSIDSLPDKTVISMLVNDPRFYKRPVKRRSNVTEEDVLNLVVSLKEGNFNKKEHNSQLFSVEGRNSSYENQMTIKQINQRRRKLENPGQVKLPLKDEDCKIPILILVDSSHSKKYRVVVPWYWVSPIWLNLVRIPKILPSGLLQMEQINFELSKPFYPNDYPFAKDGFIENELVARESKLKWSKKPKGKRLNYESVVVCPADYSSYGFRGELGNYFNCDWRFLQLLQILLKVYKKLQFTQETASLDVNRKLLEKMTIWDNKTFLRKVYKVRDIYEFIKDIKVVDAEKSARGEKLVNPIILNSYGQADIAHFNHVINKYIDLPNDAVTNKEVTALLENRLPVRKVSIKLISGGKIKSNARIYKVDDATLKIIKASRLENINSIVTETPSFEHLIGFMTTGAFNLLEGKYTGLGCVVSEEAYDAQSHSGYCIVRNSGSRTVRVGRYTVYK